MKPAKKKELLIKLRAEINKARVSANKTEKTAKEFKSASRSQQGERRYYETAYHLSQDRLELLLELEKEITSTHNNTPEKVESVSFIKVEYENGATGSFYFANIGIKLANLQVVTPDSPIGKSIAGKKEDFRFSYQVNNEGKEISFSGKIIKIE